VFEGVFANDHIENLVRRKGRRIDGLECDAVDQVGKSLCALAAGEVDTEFVQINAKHSGSRLSDLNRQSSVATPDLEDTFAAPIARGPKPPPIFAVRVALLVKVASRLFFGLGQGDASCCRRWDNSEYY